jgi:Tol biopolymer transport system component/imidazolonepropionase-like amidohydrolase
VAAGCATPQGPSPEGGAALETISITATEGTTLGFDISPDGRTIVFDLLGQIWTLPAEGGEARPITDAVRDVAEDLDPSWSPDGRTIAFRGERNGRTGLWLLDVSSGAIRQATQLDNPDGFDGAVAWRPDGKQLAFERASGSSGVALLDAAALTAQLVPLDGLAERNLRDPAWTPDGRLAFVAGDRAGGPIGTAAAGGGAVTWLSPDTAHAYAPAFAADGRRIAYLAKAADGRLQVWIQELGGSLVGAPRRLTDHADVTPTRVRWMPDGGSVLYSADGGLWRVDVAGGVPVRIPFTARLTLTRPRRPLAPARFPEPGIERPARGFTDVELSPDASRIAVLALGQLWVMPVGGAPRPVARVPLTARNLAWRPDGSEIAWTAGNWGREDLYATEIPGGTTRQLTSLPDRELLPAWSPDGRWLAFVDAPATGSRRLRVVEASALPVADSSATRALGTVAIPWLAHDAIAPVWSPGSDAVLHFGGGHGSRATKTTVGRLLPLSGSPKSIPRFPDSPIYFRWTEGSLTWVRHDRLWRAPFDSTGLLGDAVPLGDSPALYASASQDGTMLFASGDGLVLRATDGSERHLGWPIRFTPPEPAPLLIRNLRVIAGTGAGPTAPQDVLIQHGRVAQIGRAGTLRVSGAETLDAAGRFAIPGLMDLHAHFYQAALLPDHLYFGITTIRDQGSAMASLVAWADAIAAGVTEGPRVAYGAFQYYTDWAYDGDEGRGIEPEADSAHVRRSVALAAGFGAQHVKTRTFRRWDINARIIAEAHRLGMRATGHCAHPLPLVVAGMDAQEHTESCPPRGGTGAYDDIAQLYRAAGIGVVPTVTYMGFPARISANPQLYASDSVLAPFAPPVDDVDWMVKMTPEERREVEHSMSVGRRTTAMFQRAGVTVGVGTDTWQVPNGVHYELEELVRSGFTPLEAIGAATASSARILGAEAELGTIEVGKRADLVLLDADPTADIQNTQRIWRVLKDGKVVDREAIARAAADR